MDLFEIFEHAKWEVHKFHGDSTDEKDLFEVIEGEGNLLMYGGASSLWHRLTGGTSVVAFDDSNSRIGVGTSTTVAAASQTDLQGVSGGSAFRKIADMTHTDSSNASGAAAIVFVSTYTTAEANFAWNEWGIFNGDGTGGAVNGRMLNRRVEALGTKTSAATWQLTITLTLGGGA